MLGKFVQIPTESAIATGIVAAIFLLDLIIRIWLLVYIPKNRKPTAATAWLLLIFILPIFGTMIFFVIGGTKLSKRRRQNQQQITTMFERYTKNLRDAGLIARIKEPYNYKAKLAESLTDMAPTLGNTVSIMSGYDDLIHKMTANIHRAKQYVYVEFFAIALDTSTEAFFIAMEDAVKRGVKVYVLFDYLGSKKYPRYKEMKKRLTDIGVKWYPMLPLTFKFSKYNRPDLRNHRKIVVIDNTDAYIGSLNLIDKTYHRKDDISYIELVAHFQGPTVNEAAAVFASDWYCESGKILKHFMTNSIPSAKGAQIAQIIPSGPGYPYENNLKFFVSLIQSAERSVTITNPYLVPDESLLGALLSASLRGVKVSILNSEAMDQWMVGHAQRSYYEELIRAGVSIWLYKKPQLVHEKFISVDDEVAIIGSSNLDIRSFELNHECTIAVYDVATAQALVKHHRHLLQSSTKVRLASWRKRSGWQSFLDSIARLTSALQ
jgi:cardiolipin synthase